FDRVLYRNQLQNNLPLDLNSCLTSSPHLLLMCDIQFTYQDLTRPEPTDSYFCWTQKTVILQRNPLTL
ncbi:MAG: hypothetical protein VX294_00605, partial [Candidatus Latescibacterota bacterium]|nr:hypothetical protein [Candidatus Latescibacterota bacterium]